MDKSSSEASSPIRELLKCVSKMQLIHDIIINFQCETTESLLQDEFVEMERFIISLNCILFGYIRNLPIKLLNTRTCVVLRRRRTCNFISHLVSSCSA